MPTYEAGDPEKVKIIFNYLKEKNMTEAEKRARQKYDQAHKDDYRNYFIKCNKETDADIIKYLDAVKNKQGFIKELIRAHIS